jgi:Na+/proline symporter
VLMILIYTFRSGIGTIVWTDALQTLILFASIILMLFQVTQSMNLSFSETIHTIKESPLSRIFVFDWISDRNFFKQFFSGIFIVVVMTGLSQDMVQSTLSCRSLREAQKNMFWYGAAFVPFNLLLLSLGVLLVAYAGQAGIALPEKADEIVPMFTSGLLGKTVCFCFIIGIIAATFTSADSALAAIVTSVYIDILKKDSNTPNSYKQRNLHYLLVCLAFVLIVLAFDYIGNHSIIDTLYMLVGYAYGPLLGLFAFGLLTRRQINDRATPYIALLSPILTFSIDAICRRFFHYPFGYELLILNGMITYTGLCLSKDRKTVRIVHLDL